MTRLFFSGRGEERREEVGRRKKGEGGVERDEGGGVEGKRKDREKGERRGEVRGWGRRGGEERRRRYFIKVDKETHSLELSFLLRGLNLSL